MTSRPRTRRRPQSPPHGGRGRTAAGAGFTLLELMITVSILGLMATIAYRGSASLLPQTELRATAMDVAGAIEKARLHAILVAEPLVFAYDLEAQTYEAYYPYERGESGERLGPGRFPVIDPRAPRGVIRISAIRLLDTTRDDGRVELEIAASGQMPSHEVVVVMPEFEEFEVYTVRALGADTRPRVLQGDVAMEIPTDATFR